MAARKLAQEVDKCFKKVAEGVAEFEAIYEKIEQATNQAQKEKLEDNLKREIKKLQRLRDQIKTWAASNDIKDKAPLLDHRKLIETQMEKFKAVEKAMKTKAYSKEGLSAAAKLDPKEQAKMEAGEFLGDMVEQLEQQIETLEAEGESLQATMKKGKGHGAKADRVAKIERIIERHKWHQGKLELIRRSLENGNLETEQVTDLQETIKYYVTDGQNEDADADDEGMYDDLNLDEEEVFGLNQDGDKGSSQDAQSVAEDTVPEPDPKPAPTAKTRGPAETAPGGGRRPSAQLKSPLPALATLHTPLQTISNGVPPPPATMKPASLPPRPAEGLKYASAAAAAAASDKNNFGLSPLPPPPPSSGGVGYPSVANQSKTSATSSPAISTAQPATSRDTPQLETRQPVPSSSTPEATKVVPSSSNAAPAPSQPAASSNSEAKSRVTGKAPTIPETTEPAKTGANEASKRSQKSRNVEDDPSARTNGLTNGIRGAEVNAADEESIYHLPSSLQDLVDSYETSRKRSTPAVNSQASMRMLQLSQAQAPGALDMEPLRPYFPEMRMPANGSHFPQEPLPIFNDPRLYSRVDSDTLFYVFYYKQGTDQQYLAAKALKDQSWRFHKQYQTWFQRHEEPKNITEEFEQGTYRFFDYESTWMNRRKADFKFAYKFLEDDL